MVKDKVTVPVIASSGAGKVEHFSEVFKATDEEATQAAGIFHRKEEPIADVKKHLQEEGIEIRFGKYTDSHLQNIEGGYFLEISRNLYF